MPFRSDLTKYYLYLRNLHASARVLFHNVYRTDTLKTCIVFCFFFTHRCVKQTFVGFLLEYQFFICNNTPKNIFLPVVKIVHRKSTFSSSLQTYLFRNTPTVLADVSQDSCYTRPISLQWTMYR